MFKRKTKAEKRIERALKAHLARERANPTGKRIRKNSTTIRGAKSVTVKQNADGTISLKVRR